MHEQGSGLHKQLHQLHAGSHHGSGTCCFTWWKHGCFLIILRIEPPTAAVASARVGCLARNLCEVSITSLRPSAGWHSTLHLHQHLRHSCQVPMGCAGI